MIVAAPPDKLRPGVLVIYTGGTIGSKPRDPDPASPQVVVPWPELSAATPELQRLPFAVDCFDEIPPLDSCNVGPTQWKAMADAISRHYEDYTGFVILHGTDTMVYTASALSFMLLELAKPVIITGSQRSALVSTRNDATQNLLTALEIANPTYSNLPIVPEVCIYFGGKLLRGNRARKRDTVGYEAYETPNIPPLGEAGDRIVINEKLIRPLPERGKQFRVRTRLDEHVMPISVYPGIQDTKIAHAQLATEGLRAAVVQSFGSGNIPTNPQFLAAFNDARERGIILANVSQCARGPVELGIYETSAELLEMGFVAASDITAEAALCKLMVLLGDPDLDVEAAELLFQHSMAGEQSVSLWVTRFGASAGRLDGSNARHRIRAVPLEGQWNSQFIDRALLRLRGAMVVHDSPDARDEAVSFRTFLNLDPDQPPDDSSPSFAGRTKKWAMSSPGVVLFDVTKAMRATTKAGDRLSITLLLDTPSAVLTWESAELAVFVKEIEV